MKDKCTKEWCWIEQPEIKSIDDEELHQDTFRPEHPEEWNKQPKTWLTNFDIDAVMSQYEDIYPDFKFFGTILLTNSLIFWGISGSVQNSGKNPASKTHV